MLLNLWELSVIHSKINLRIYGIASSLSDSELNGFKDKMEVIELINRSDVQKNLYNALVEAYNTNKDLLSSYGNVIIIPTTRDDKDKDEEPSARSNRGTKRRRSGKEAGHPNNQLVKKKRRRTTSSSKGLQISTYRLNETTTSRVHSSDENVIPAREVQEVRTQSSFDEFMATPIDFSAFMINRLKIDHLTQELIIPVLTYDLHKRKKVNEELRKGRWWEIVRRRPTAATKDHMISSYDVLIIQDRHGPPDACTTSPQPLKKEIYTSRESRQREILLKLNLPDHRILKDGGEVTNQNGMSMSVQKSQDHKMTKSQDGETRLCLVDDLTVLKITSPLTSKDKGTSSSLKSKITTTYSTEESQSLRAED
ncbi:hypothetical protein Tco_0606007 [Tanacetum coccineum]